MARALARAHEAGYDAAQVFPGNPTGWRHVPLSPEAAQAARATADQLQLAPIVIHAPYIINVATADAELAAKSARLLAGSLERAAEIGARYVVVHAGSHKGAGEAAGLENVARLVERLLSEAPSGATLLVENSAFAGNALAGSPTALGRLLRELPERVGTCIDTAHLWGSGCDLSSAEGVERALDELETAVGLERIRVLHLNDSAVALGSHRDVHAHLGEGAIGLDGLAAWLQHPAQRGKPVVLETPEEDDPAREAVRCAIARLLMDGDVDSAREQLAGLANGDTVAAGSESVELLSQSPTAGQ
jgi:deoxyribonuclease-4